MAEVIRNLSNVVAEMAPNTYKTAITTGMSEQDAKLVDQLMRSAKLGKELLSKSKEKARKEFLALDPQVQKNIYSVYSSEEIFQPEKSTTQKILGVIGKPFLPIATPLVAGFKVAETWGKTFNTFYTAKQQLEQGADFSKALISDAFNGKNSWRWEEVAKYEAKYGKALITLARGTAEKRSIGKTIEIGRASCRERV